MTGIGWLPAIAAVAQAVSVVYFAVIVAGAITAVASPALLPALVYGRGHDLQHGGAQPAGVVSFVRRLALQAGVRTRWR